MSIPTTMRAQLMSSHGGPEVLQAAEMPVPALQPGHVLVRVHATAVNPIDLKIRQGLPVGPALPAVIGCDVAGVVVAVGAGVTGFREGDEVYGCTGGVKGQGGAMAQYLLADARLLAPRPKSLSMRDTAALPLAGITAWEAMERTGAGVGDFVLVQGATGGVGHLGLQIAKARGARVAASVRKPAGAALARRLGADEVIDAVGDARVEAIAALTGGRGFNVVFDTVGGASLDLAFAAAATGGRVAAIAARSTHDLSPLHAKGLSLHVVFMLLPMLQNQGRERHGAILRALAELVDSGALRPLVDERRFVLAQAADAHRHLESGQATGKVVIEVE
ncbi:MAG: zinc-dependent alcohol dehydrogenase family protein [Polaromonas sp.]|nr:zinc-dependent alcohol dehydrogenase family protein [Polaromonas sp.]